MNSGILHLGSLRDVGAFASHLRKLGIAIPVDLNLLPPAQTPLGLTFKSNRFSIGNRFAIQPMEGWDGTPDGRPSELTIRRWQNFGRSGAKLIWGGEAVAVCHDGRANPNQLLINGRTRDHLARLRETLIAAAGSDVVVGLQLTHSGRFSRPNSKRSEPRILYRHPILDRRLDLPSDYPLLTDGDIREIIEDFHRAARMADEIGFDFVDIKHCHGYLGHEFLSAHMREGDYGGSFDNRTRFLREVVEGVRAVAPRLELAVRLSAFDSIPFGKSGEPESFEGCIPYRWGFGVNPENPIEPDLTEPIQFLSLLRTLNIQLVNITGGSPYTNPHMQRPALFPPSDGYQPPEDPLIGVARQMDATRALKRLFPEMLFVGTAYTYLQDFLPFVAQAAVREGWVDVVGLGRIVLSYPELARDVLEGRPLDRKRFCRTFSDCTTAPRNALPSGCYPLDAHYKASEAAKKLRTIKNAARGGT
ncbi:MAG TPA: NADH:flavin oxidoreductase [Terriglobia bacterium]|nr:NADH:flavin oxidoreductase [Terriglobia bacterium]